jgi:aspartyl-tRNA(Asn)/glutamyl-tRNA(Gln) amidotransferase subunit A
MNLFELSLAEAAAGLREKKFSSQDLVRACVERADAGKALSNFITRTDELALKQAASVDAKLAAGEELGLLAGVPAGMKDILNTKNVRTTCASRMLENFVSPYESTVTRRLLDEDYVLFGKLNMDEFACGASTESSYFGTSLNPWNKEYVAGGSSGGSASAVAAGQCFYSIGTDTGGSIRQPASLCGCVGLKVTYGRVSRFGVTAMASSWDTVGPMARTVEDVAIVLKAIAGDDKYDATTPPVAVPDYTADLSKGAAALRIGVPAEYFGEGVDEEVRKSVMAAVKEYEKMGAQIVQISLPMTKYGVAVYYVTMPGELSTNLARFDGLRFGHSVASGDAAEAAAATNDLLEYYMKTRGESFGAEIKRRIMVGTFVLSAGYSDEYYKQAQRVRTLLARDFEKAFEEVDVIMGPVSPTPAFKAGAISDPLELYMADVLTIPASAAGLPAISVPCGFSKEGLPIGLQIIGPQFQEGLILQAAAAYEQVSGLRGQVAKI